MVNQLIKLIKEIREKMPTYKQIFINRFSNKNGNIKKGTKVIEVWNSIEEFLRLVLDPKNKPKKSKLTIK